MSSAHDFTGGACRHEACEHLGVHATAECAGCDGVRHAVASNWDAYSSGRQVAFLTACPSCGTVDYGRVLGVTWTVEELARASVVARRALGK